MFQPTKLNVFRNDLDSWDFTLGKLSFLVSYFFKFVKILHFYFYFFIFFAFGFFFNFVSVSHIAYLVYIHEYKTKSLV